MRATHALLFIAPLAIAANQPTFTYALPANTTVAAMTVDAVGNTYLTGSTSSSSFPATAGALQTQFSGGICEVLLAPGGGRLMFPCTDAFVIKLDPAGNVLLATYFGGNGSQTVASAICVDASGNIYLGGSTSPNIVNQPETFPVTAGAAFTNPADNFEFVAKLNATGTQLVYSTLLPVNPGSAAMQRAVAMAVDLAGEVYIASTNAGALPFPTTAGAFQSAPPSYPYGSGVVAKLNASGSALLYATYLSGSGLSIPQGIAIDAAGDAFVAGFTEAPDFPVTPGAFQTGYFPSAEYMEFVAKLNPQGTGLVYSTFLGATSNSVSDIKVDSQGGAYVSAQGGVELSEGGYLSHISADGSALVYSTYIPTATGFGFDLDSAGSVFVAGASGMAVLAASPGAFQSGLVGSTGNVIAAKFTSNGQFSGATYAEVSPTAGAGPLISVAPNGATMLAEQATVISIFPWLTVQNAASGAASTVAPGEIVTLRGYGLGPATAAVASSQAPVDQLGGTQVTFGGIAAPVFSAQSQQVTVQVPWEIAGQTSTEVVVTYNGPPAVASAPVVVGPSTPGIYAVANSDGTLNSPSNPAKMGGFIAIYGTGGGVTNPLGITGGLWPITTSLPTLALPVSVSIGGTNAIVLYAGSAPTLESGYFQINVSPVFGPPALPLPAAAIASSAVNLVLTVGGASDVTVPIYIQ
jgi:uncharacterized protein (TIGR03437 family)